MLIYVKKKLHIQTYDMTDKIFSSDWTPSGTPALAALHTANQCTKFEDLIFSCSRDISEGIQI